MKKRFLSGVVLVVGGLTVIGLMMLAQKQKNKADVMQSMVDASLRVNDSQKPATQTPALYSVSKK